MTNSSNGCLLKYFNYFLYYLYFFLSGLKPIYFNLKKFFLCRTVLPLSMLSFKTCCTLYSLNRKLVTSISSSVLKGLNSTGDQDKSGKKAKNKLEESDNHELVVESRGDIKDGQYLILQHCYRKHVKPKKQHEITNLAEVCGFISLRLFIFFS